ncbi:transcriptional regulator, GntR family with aminotransferase domain [Beutenbergia cavernae DSM 12333]|uniref:Transcriptional regulator, GntR family with aminotransferase domain n=1 Tax=Beutenbergia cavernae (strain ATCC BAA-8 / DSM 12333 / CCUG 43141 / JCM 11478 / NBRC 16432 / NCIMB 13614 / HKI 0122) TaxID=471853 RepID=C5BUT6_BEUC1|nr:PLP-dependent aminotransferase family protein [Beutenbergia cavernae]ACQ78310.1 transcriptional regulator, GntR family with aminotransferase domain [Beutenbergia cavernae DSM 12333]
MGASQTDLAWDTLVDLAPAGGDTGPLHVRLTSALRSLIASGVVPDGAALPPSRTLARDLGCSRWAVTEAYAQLAVEGYLTARSGSVTRVRSGVAPPASPPAAMLDDVARRAPYDLAPGVADLRAFPRHRWVEATRTVLSALPADDLARAVPGGHPRTRRLLAEYLRRSRAVDTGAAALVVTAGAGSAMGWLARRLVAAGHTRLAVEEPSWPVLPDLARRAGLETVPIAVDDDGLCVDDLRAHPDVRAVLLTPAHQFPTGAAMSPVRRAEVTAWARERDGVVIEDDYDAEFRYDRKPVAALQALDPQHVVLLGSLSKSLSSAVGLGWLVGPTALLADVAEPGGAPPTPGVLTEQIVAEMIERGWYERHLRSVRTGLRRRRDALVAALGRRLPDCPVSGLAAGMHLVLRLPADVRAADVVARAAELDVGVVPMSRYLGGGVAGHGGVARSDQLVLGYGNLADSRVEDAVARLAVAVRSRG